MNAEIFCFAASILFLASTVGHWLARRREQLEKETRPAEGLQWIGPSGPSMILLDDEAVRLVRERDELRMWCWKQQVKGEISEMSKARLAAAIHSEREGR